MRHALSLLLVLPVLAPAPALANNHPLSARCDKLSRFPLTTETDAPKLEAMISTASCVADARIEDVDVQPTEDSVLALNAAVQPSMRLYDAVIEHGDLDHRIIAEHAKAALYDALAVRVRAAVTPMTGRWTEAKQVAFHDRVASTDRLVQAWLQLADDAHADVSRLAKTDPELLVRNPVLADIVYDSRLEAAAAIATREPTR
jgi:hypothetical protein